MWRRNTAGTIRARSRSCWNGSRRRHHAPNGSSGRGRAGGGRAGQQLAIGIWARRGALNTGIGEEVARALGGDLDAIVARKLGSPISGELAVGAVTADGVRYLHDAVIADLQVPDSFLDAVTEEARNRASRFAFEVVDCFMVRSSMPADHHDLIRITVAAHRGI